MISVLIARARRVSSVGLVVATLALALGTVPAEPAGAVGVVPTQWVAKIFTEALGRAPSGSAWNYWMAYYTPRGCTKDTLATLGRSVYKDPSFTTLYPESTSRAGRVLALVRGVYSHEPNTNDWNAYYAPYAAGTETWSQVVDSIFDNGVFGAKVPTICDANSPDYGFGSAPVPDLKAMTGRGASRTQRQLQQELDAAAPSCGTVTMTPNAVVRIGGAQPAGDPQNNPLWIPSCVTLTTIGSPGPAQYADMGRLVSNGLVCAAPGVTCDHIEMVRMGNGASLTHVWVDGKGLAANARLALVGIASGQSPTTVDDDRFSDAPAGGTAVRVVGYGTTGVACARRDISRNLVTGYSTEHAQTRLGKALWADGISNFCEQATIQANDLVDVSGDGIVVYGVWNTEAGQAPRTQHSTVSGNHVASAGISATVAYGADATGECDAEVGGSPAGCIQFSDDRSGYRAERSFAGTSVTQNTFWSGPRTAFDIGLMIGSKPLWGDNAPYARGASFTNNTTDGVAGTRVNTGIAIAGMYDATLIGNTPTYTLVDTQPTVDASGKCRRGNVFYGYYVGNVTSGSQGATGTSSGLYQCLAPPPPAAGLERIVVGPSHTLAGADSGEPFVPWGQNYNAYTLPLSDLREMKEMGANVIRLHLQFHDFMTNCTTANQTMLDQLGQTVRAAEQNAMYLDLTGLASYAGDQADPACYRGATTDAQRWNAQAAFWGAVARQVASSPAVLDLDLANEPIIPDSAEPVGCGWANCPGGSPGTYFNQVITQDPAGRTADQIATAWTKQLTNAIRQFDTRHLVTIGCLPFTNCAGFDPKTVAPLLGYLSVHIYPEDCTAPPPPPGTTDPCSSAERSQERLSGDPLGYEQTVLNAFAAAGKPVVVEETGVLTASTLQGDFLFRSRSQVTGWIGQWRPQTISEFAASGTINGAVYAAWGQQFQDLAHVLSPCGTCSP